MNPDWHEIDAEAMGELPSYTPRSDTGSPRRGVIIDGAGRFQRKQYGTIVPVANVDGKRGRVARERRFFHENGKDAPAPYISPDPVLPTSVSVAEGSPWGKWHETIADAMAAFCAVLSHNLEMRAFDAECSRREAEGFQVENETVSLFGPVDPAPVRKASRRSRKNPATRMTAEQKAARKTVYALCGYELRPVRENGEYVYRWVNNGPSPLLAILLGAL